MVQKWFLCIEVSCFPNPGRAVVKLVLYNMEINHFLHGKREVARRMKNNETYYTSIVEGIKKA